MNTQYICPHCNTTNCVHLGPDGKGQFNASHLSQSATDTRENIKQLLKDEKPYTDSELANQGPTRRSLIYAEVEAYWKSKEGHCLACNAEIAVQDQYCPACEAFLIETRPQ